MSMSVVDLYTHTHPFNGPLSRTTRVGRYQKGKTNLDFTEARDSEWQWNPLGHVQVCTLLQTDNHASIPPLSFLQAGCPSCRPTNSVKALKAKVVVDLYSTYNHKPSNVPYTLLKRAGCKMVVLVMLCKGNVRAVCRDLGGEWLFWLLA